MKAVRYSFHSVWLIEAPLTDVWEAIFNVTEWPRWWKGVEKMEVVKAPHLPYGPGTVIYCRWRSFLPYTLTFDAKIREIKLPDSIDLDASGELEGQGTWVFHKLGPNKVQLEYIWRVRTTKKWMNVLAHIGRPVFVWSHNYLMRQGEIGLRRYLGS